MICLYLENIFRASKGSGCSEHHFSQTQLQRHPGGDRNHPPKPKGRAHRGLGSRPGDNNSICLLRAVLVPVFGAIVPMLSVTRGPIVLDKSNQVSPLHRACKDSCQCPHKYSQGEVLEVMLWKTRTESDRRHTGTFEELEDNSLLC